MSRLDKTEYFLGIAEAVAKRSTCLRRQYGAVIVKDDVIVSTGYNGSPRNVDNCCNVGSCWRATHNIPHGERYEMCQAVHAEANAIINANRADMNGATLYLVGLENGKRIEKPEPCLLCRKLIRNAQIRRVES
jgi:dCMP deaminase